MRVELTTNCSLQNSNEISLKLVRNGSFDLVIELIASKTGKRMLLSKLRNVYGSIRLTDGNNKRLLYMTEQLNWTFSHSTSLTRK